MGIIKDKTKAKVMGHIFQDDWRGKKLYQDSLVVYYWLWKLALALEKTKGNK